MDLAFVSFQIETAGEDLLSSIMEHIIQATEALELDEKADGKSSDPKIIDVDIRNEVQDVSSSISEETSASEETSTSGAEPDMQKLYQTFMSSNSAARKPLNLLRTE